MADRSFFMNHQALQANVVDLFCTITVGSTGAVTSFTGLGAGIASVVRNSAGKYTITLEDSYNTLLWADVRLLHSTNSDPATVAILGRLFAETVNSSTPTVVIQGVALDDGAAADFASGALLYVKLTLKNSSVA